MKLAQIKKVIALPGKLCDHQSHMYVKHGDITMIMQNQVFTTPSEEMSSHLIKCVLKKPEFLVIEGKQYLCGVKTRQLEILVSDLTKDAVMEMLLSIGLSAWELVDWWAVFELEPCF